MHVIRNNLRLSHKNGQNKTETKMITEKTVNPLQISMQETQAKTLKITLGPVDAHHSTLIIISQIQNMVAHI